MVITPHNSIDKTHAKGIPPEVRTCRSSSAKAYTQGTLNTSRKAFPITRAHLSSQTRDLQCARSRTREPAK